MGDLSMQFAGETEPSQCCSWGGGGPRSPREGGRRPAAAGPRGLCLPGKAQTGAAAEEVQGQPLGVFLLSAHVHGHPHSLVSCGVASGLGSPQGLSAIKAGLQGLALGAAVSHGNLTPFPWEPHSLPGLQRCPFVAALELCPTHTQTAVPGGLGQREASVTVPKVRQGEEGLRARRCLASALPGPRTCRLPPQGLDPRSSGCRVGSQTRPLGVLKVWEAQPLPPQVGGLGSAKS